MSSDPWGRVDETGTVYVRTADGEKVVGSWQAGSPEEALAYFEQAYDHVFFIPVEFALPRDGAPISDRFQLEAGQQLFELLSLTSKPVHVLTGSLEERLAVALDVLGLKATVA